MKVSDYIIQRLELAGVKYVFMVSGGGAMHLIDSLGKSKKIKYVCCHHEQACAMAAEGYARASGKLGVVIVTSGPGGTNCITGVTGQWVDSVPVLYISGQVKYETTIESCREIGLRQLGDQEINIVDIVKPITKYSNMVKVIDCIGLEIRDAIFLARNGRPAPVWLDIPLNIQGASMDEKNQCRHDDIVNTYSYWYLKETVYGTIELLKQSSRPLIVLGNGARASKAEALKMIDRLTIPVVSTFNGFDLISSDHPLYIGRIGTVGDRAGNFALQNADFVLFLGTRNNIRQVSYDWQSFAKNAKKVVVDIDSAELQKKTVKPDIAINTDVGMFIKEFDYIPSAWQWVEWRKWCNVRKYKYPVVLPEYFKKSKPVNPYVFVQALTRAMDKQVLVAGNGSASVVLFQAAVVKKDSRMFMNSGCAAMGYDLPAAIGAAFATGKDVVCLTGDGSIQMNIQELQTIVNYKLPIKIFYLNNEGYVSMKQTQDAYFGRRVGADKKSGVIMPDIKKIAKAYGIRYYKIDNQKNIYLKCLSVLKLKGAVICEVKLLTDYKFSPKLSSEALPDGRIISKSLEDMSPLLPRKEFESNMIKL